MNYSKTAHEIIDLIKSSGMNIAQTKEILSECSQIADTPTIRYIDEKLYNLKDICYTFNQNMEEVINYMNNNNIIYIRDSEENLYICGTALDGLWLLLNRCISIEDLNDEIKHAIFNECKIDIKSKNILPQKKYTSPNQKKDLIGESIKCERVSSETPRITMER